MIRRLVVAAIAAACLLGSTAAWAIDGPIAVMPFRNLNQDPDLEWLSLGIAETMISDIRNRSMTVVERDQIDRAISEIALQQTKAVDATTAAAVGRVVGAKTIVVGGYQKAGSQIRITARFVVVETGVVQDTAKVTDNIQRIFKMQDQIVTRLLGLKAAPHATPRPKASHGPTPKPTQGAKVLPSPPPTDRTVKAYKLYALSLNAKTDIERQEMLQASLEIDPSFRYARHDLDALERRMREYHERAMRALSAELGPLYDTFRNEDKPEHERSAAALKLHMAYITNGYYQADLALAEEIYKADWRDPNFKSSMRETGLNAMMQAYAQLGRYDQALQVGEQFLQEFPLSLQKMGVEYSMKSYIQKKREMGQSPAKARAALAALEEEMKEAEQAPEEYRQMRVASVRLRRCTDLYNAYAYVHAIHECRSMADDYANVTSDMNIAEWVRLARFYLAKAQLGAGRFEAARETANQLIEDEPEFASKMYLDMQVRQWPQ